MEILRHAIKILEDRDEEKQRQYGDFNDGMERAAKIASGATGKDLTTQDMFMCMVALKLSRQSYNHKYDNLLDAIAYLAQLNDYEELLRV